MRCYEVEVTRTDGKKHKTLMWGETQKEIRKKINKEYGKDARPIRIAQL